MSVKKESPARPPPPKNKKGDGGSPMKFSFKSLEQEEEDEEDLTVFTGNLMKKVESDKQILIEKKSVETSDKKTVENRNNKISDNESKTELKTPQKDSEESKKNVPSQRSLDSPQHSSAMKSESPPNRSSSDNKLHKYASKPTEEEGSAISWLKQNVAEISSAVRDKAEKARKRIEEFSENIGKDEEMKADPSKRSTLVSRLSSKSLNEKELSPHEVKQEITKPLRAASIAKLKDINSGDLDVKEQGTVVQDEKDEVKLEEFDIVDDFFTSEPFEDFTGIPSSMDKFDSGSVKKSKTSLKRRFVKGKVPSSINASPVSMSKLSKDKVDELEEGTSAFFDAKDESVQMKATTNNLNEPSKLKNLATSVESHAQRKKLIIIVVSVFLYMIIPLPSYVSGMIMGSFLASLGWITYNFITKPATLKDPFKQVPYKDLPPLIEPEIKDVSLDEEVTVHKGWMNEISDYNQDNYHINKTHSVHVYLDGTTLRLRHPKQNISKRAMWDEEPLKVNEFIHQRYFDLVGSRVFLLPQGLVKKRIWSKKYPVCIALQRKGKKQINDVNESLPESDRGFEIISEESCDESILYLFARTCREKEEWYKRFEAACRGQPLKHHLVEVKKFFVNRKTSKQASSPTQDSQTKRQTPEGTPQHSRHGSTDSISSTNSTSPVNETPDSSEFNMEEFIRYMGRTMPKEYSANFLPPYKRNPIENKDSHYMIDCDPQLLWLNALISRCSWDFLHQKYWADKIMDKLQKKLDKIHIPYFIEAFKITDINLGAEMPVIRRAGKPYLDNQGFWVDLDVNYGGGFKMTILTKVNLMKLKKTTTEEVKEEKEKDTEKKSAITNSDEEDSAESSTDEDEEVLPQGNEDGSSAGGKRKFMRYLKKITDSKYFQSATEMKYVKKAMEEVSNTPLVLTVELRFLSGKLAINIPPPPTDRLWYGFRGNPKLTLVAKPKVGERRVTVSHITEFIEKRLSVEFQRVFVMPNMDDLVIPLLLPEYAPDSIPEIPETLSSSVLLPSPSSPV